MFANNNIWISGNGNESDNTYLQLTMANRHGLIAGASGTGKTVTLKVLAEGFSDAGVPVFMADVKGDLSGTCTDGVASDAMTSRIGAFGISSWQYKHFPTVFWDVFGEKGIPLRTTITEMGPLLLSRLLGLSDVQEGVLNIAFRIAADQNMAVIDIKDLRALLTYVGDNAQQYETTYGAISTKSVGSILRSLIQLEDQGGINFFGEPSFDIHDWIATDSDGRGIINIMESVKLIQSPLLYSFFMLWMLTELYEKLPEVGDCKKPKLVFFFDEAHLLFSDMPKVLLQKVIQTIKLVRSKGVGVYFISQSPSDIPDDVLAQLSNRIQHALRAYTPKEQKAVATAAETFRPNPNINTAQAITELSTGEALISLLQPDGSPSIVQRQYILPPQSYMSPIDDDIRNSVIMTSPMNQKYRKLIDNPSVFEKLNGTSSSAALGEVTENKNQFSVNSGADATQQTANNQQYQPQQQQYQQPVDNQQYQQPQSYQQTANNQQCQQQYQQPVNNQQYPPQQYQQPVDNQQYQPQQYQQPANNQPYQQQQQPIDTSNMNTTQRWLAERKRNTANTKNKSYDKMNATEKWLADHNKKK